jgi:hypothetical protein
MTVVPVHPLRAIAPKTTLSEPVIHPRHEEIDKEVIKYLTKTWEWPSERHKKVFISWKLSDVVLFMFPTGDFHRVKLATELLLVGFLMDGRLSIYFASPGSPSFSSWLTSLSPDWFDKHTQLEITALVDRLFSLLDHPSTTPGPLTTIERMHARLFALIPDRLVLDAYMEMLACHTSPSRGHLGNMAVYLAFREADVGMPICMALLQWTEDFSSTALSLTTAAALQPMERLANYHVSVLNDIFSYERERKAAEQDGAPLVNGVQVLADETGISVAAAKAVCFALVRAWEAEFQRLAATVIEAAEEETERETVRRLVQGMERRMNGAEAFSWRTRRYL